MFQVELELIYKKVPDFAKRVIEAAKTGTIDPNHYVSDGSGCVYGHIKKLNPEDASRLCWKNREILEVINTPLEELIRNVKAGETNETNADLQTLVELCTPFLQK